MVSAALAVLMITAPGGTGVGPANVSGALPEIDISAPAADASGATTASGALATITVDAPAADAAGAAAVTGDIGTVTVSSPAGSVATPGSATGAVATVTVSSPAGSVGVPGNATGAVPTVTVDSPTAGASGGGAAVAPTIVQKAFAYSDNPAVTPTFGSTPTVGNLVIALYAGVIATITAGLNGWTLGSDARTSPVEVAWFYRYVLSGDGTTYGVPFTASASNGYSLAIYEINGSTLTGSPKDIDNVACSAAGATSTGVPAVTTTAPEELAFAWGGYTNFFANAPTISGASFTQDFSHAGTWSVFTCGHAVIASTGTTGSPTIAWNATSANGLAIGMLTIKT